MDLALPERPDFLPPGFGTVGHQDFVEIVAPEPVPYQPSTAGWAVLLALLLLAAGWGAWSLIRRYRNNAYRRAARRELAQLRVEAARDREAALVRLPGLLKRCALSAYPRQQVAGLTGARWMEFLEDAAPSVLSDEVKESLQLLIVADPKDSPQQRDAAIFDGVDGWVRRHRA